MMSDKAVVAVLKKIRVSPQKLNVVASMIRGMFVHDALASLRCSKRRIAGDVYKTLFSAVSNAENNHGMDSESLYVKEAYVGHSLKLKRFHPRGRGRGERVIKPFSRLSIVVKRKG
jgi:large subunit ribosomal protein L22